MGRFKNINEFTYAGKGLENIRINGKDMLFELGGFAYWAKRNEETGLFHLHIDSWVYGYCEGTESICKFSETELIA